MAPSITTEMFSLGSLHCCWQQGHFLQHTSISQILVNSGVNRCTAGLSSPLTVPHSHRSSGFPPVCSGCCSLLVYQSVRLDGWMASYLSHCLSTLKHFGMRTESQTPAVINAGATVWVKRSWTTHDGSPHATSAKLYTDISTLTFCSLCVSLSHSNTHARTHTHTHTHIYLNEKVLLLFEK